MFDNKLELKKKIIDELMDDLDMGEAKKLGPKELSIEAVGVKPGSDDDESPEPNEGSPGEEKMDDEDLKRLLAEYMSK